MTNPTPLPSLTDLVRAHLATLLAAIGFVECADQARAGTLLCRSVAELLLAWAQQPLFNDRTPGRLAAGSRAAEALGHDDVEGAVFELAAHDGITAESWALVALDRWQGPRCEGCDCTWGTPEAAALAGCLDVGGGWVLCADCRSPEPEPPPPAPKRTAAPGPVRTPAPTATPAAAQLDAVTSPADAVAWWTSHTAELAAMAPTARRRVHTALAHRVAATGLGLGTLAAARGWLARNGARCSGAAAVAVAVGDSAAVGAEVDVQPVAVAVVEEVLGLRVAVDDDVAAVDAPLVAVADGEACAPSLTLVPSPVVDAETVLSRYAADVAEIRLPGEATPVWLRHRAALRTLPLVDRDRAWAALRTLPLVDRDRAWAALIEHVESVGHMAKAKWWLTKAIGEADAQRTAEAISGLVGAA